MGISMGYDSVAAYYVMTQMEKKGELIVTCSFYYATAYLTYTRGKKSFFLLHPTGTWCRQS